MRDQPTDEGPFWAAVERKDFRAALIVLMDLYGTSVHRYCRGMVGDAATAEDLLQTVFVQAHQDLATVQPGRPLRSWLLAIARHRSIDVLRRRRRWRHVVDDAGRTPEAQVADESPSAEARLVAEDWKIALEACLQRLASEARATVLLRFREEMSYEEIAAISKCSPGALRVRVARAVVALRACLERKAHR